MALNGVLNLMVLFSLFLISIDAFYKYDILFRDEEVYSPCDTPNVHFINEYIDFTNVNFEYQDDGSLYMHGYFVMLKDVGKQNNPGKIDVFKRTRGEWVNTVYSVRRPDVCTALFDPTEFWYMYFKDIEDKTCPFRKGQILNTNSSTTLSLIMPDPRLEGNFKIQILIHFTEINETMCANILVESYKVPYFE